MESWKRTISLCLIALMLASTFILIADTNAAPTRANPVLSNGSVSPSTGYTDTLFNFTVRYQDTDGDTPLYVTVVIGSTYHNMTEVTAGNGSYATGKDFFFNTYLNAGTVNYYFHTQNVLREGTRLPSSGSYNLSVQTRTTGPQLYNPSYSPARPDVKTAVNFTVYYKHPNGTAPTQIRVNLTTGNQTTYLPMFTIGTNYTSGVQYFCNYYLSQGYHHYRYEAFVSPNEHAYLPLNGSYVIYIYASASNNDPVLSNPGMSPQNPDRGENTTFWVHYSDQDYDYPYLFYLRYYREDDRTNIISVNLTLGSGNISQGVNCTKVLHFSENGTYYYFFVAHDPNGGYDNTNHYQFHVGDVPQPPRNPFIYHAGHTPSHPTVQDTINFTVTYIDDSGGAIPDYVRFFIANSSSGFTNYTLSPDHTNTSMPIHYSYLTKLANETYYYYFEAMIGRNYSRSPASGYNWVLVAAQSPPRDSPPQLSSASHTPSNPVAMQNVTFTVTYTDTDGDAPMYVNLVIGQPWIDDVYPYVNTYNMTVTGTTYSAGVTATITLRLIAKNYGYSFYTFSNGSYAHLPIHNYYNLTVGSSPHTDHAPVLSGGGYSPVRPVALSNITFSITYTDRDGDAPSSVYLHISEIISSKPGMNFSLIISGTNYVQGVTAYRTISSLAAGNYTFYFTASSNRSSTRTGYYNMTVASSSTPQQNRAPTLTNLVVYPTSPIANQTVYFTVTFTDADGDAPIYVRIHILYGSGSGYMNFSMNVQRGTYALGVSCLYSTSFMAGTYYYYFTTATANHTVTYPSSGVFTLNVGKSSSYPNGSRIAAVATIGSGTFDVDVMNDDFKVTLKSSGEGSVEVVVDPQGAEGGVIVLALDKDLIDVSSPEDLEVTVNGVRIPYRYVSDPEQMSGDDPFYYVVIGEDGPTLYVYLPDGDIQTITAKAAEETAPDHTLWYILGAVIVLLVLAAIIGISLLTSAQKRKIDAFYEDLDVGIRPEGVHSGKLLNEDEIDWDDLIQE